MRTSTKPVPTWLRVVAVAAFAIVILLVVAGLLVWNSTRLDDAQRELRDDATVVLALAAEGRYQAWRSTSSASA